MFKPLLPAQLTELLRMPRERRATLQGSPFEIPSWAGESLSVFFPTFDRSPTVSALTAEDILFCDFTGAPTDPRHKADDALGSRPVVASSEPGTGKEAAAVAPLGKDGGPVTQDFLHLANSLFDAAVFYLKRYFRFDEAAPIDRLCKLEDLRKYCSVKIRETLPTILDESVMFDCYGKSGEEAAKRIAQAQEAFRSLMLDIPHVDEERASTPPPRNPYLLTLPKSPAHRRAKKKLAAMVAAEKAEGEGENDLFTSGPKLLPASYFAKILLCMCADAPKGAAAGAAASPGETIRDVFPRFVQARWEMLADRGRATRCHDFLFAETEYAQIHTANARYTETQLEVLSEHPQPGRIPDEKGHYVVHPIDDARAEGAGVNRTLEGVVNFLRTILVKQGEVLFTGTRSAVPVPAEVRGKTERIAKARRNVEQILEMLAREELLAEEARGERFSAAAAGAAAAPRPLKLSIHGLLATIFVEDVAEIFGATIGSPINENKTTKEFWDAVKFWDGKIIDVAGIRFKIDLTFFNYGVNMGKAEFDESNVPAILRLIQEMRAFAQASQKEMGVFQGVLRAIAVMPEGNFANHWRHLQQMFEATQARAKTDADIKTRDHLQLFFEILQLWFTKDYKSNDYLFEIHIRMMLLERLLGRHVHFFCQAGKDRTGLLDEFLAAYTIFRDQYGCFPTLAERNGEKLGAIFREVHRHSCSRATVSDSLPGSRALKNPDNYYRGWLEPEKVEGAAAKSWSHFIKEAEKHIDTQAALTFDTTDFGFILGSPGEITELQWFRDDAPGFFAACLKDFTLLMTRQKVGPANVSLNLDGEIILREASKLRAREARSARPSSQHRFEIAILKLLSAFDIRDCRLPLIHLEGAQATQKYATLLYIYLAVFLNRFENLREILAYVPLFLISAPPHLKKMMPSLLGLYFARCVDLLAEEDPHRAGIIALRDYFMGLDKAAAIDIAHFRVLFQAVFPQYPLDRAREACRLKLNKVAWSSETKKACAVFFHAAGILEGIQIVETRYTGVSHEEMAAVVKGMLGAKAADVETPYTGVSPEVGFGGGLSLSANPAALLATPAGGSGAPLPEASGETVEKVDDDYIPLC